MWRPWAISLAHFQRPRGHSLVDRRLILPLVIALVIACLRLDWRGRAAALDQRRLCHLVVVARGGEEDAKGVALDERRMIGGRAALAS